MAFDPATGALKCPACGGTKPVETTGAVVEIPFAGAFRTTDRDNAKIAEDALQVTCGGCGAIVEFQPPEVAGACPFCASAIVAQPKSADAHLAPAALLPFHVQKTHATSLVQEWLGSLWFAPSGLQRLAQQDAVNGVYLPFFTYDATTLTAYHGRRGDYYYTTEYFLEADAQGRQVQRQRQVRHTRWSPCSGKVENNFNDVLICASRSVQRDKVRDCDPWDLENLVPYEPAFLAGFKAQRYQIELNEGFQVATELMAPVIDGTIRRDIGGDEQQIGTREVNYFDVTFKHVLLPVWIGAYRFQGRVFQVIVNGRTGEVQGERPYSFAKIALAVLAVVAIILVLAMLARDR
ncbi:hypothetical protein F183_A43870 [Bryobacterales bacterium F-183]|nr:hypothetical protein F183_A43870 [Bryobacterales bacterium F-183]